MRRLLLVAVGVSFGLLVTAQVSQDGTLPYSFTQSLSIKTDDVHRVIMPALDMEAITTEDEERASKGQLELISRNLQADLNLTNSGTWEALPGGDRIWRVKVQCDDAEAVVVNFSEFSLPAGAKLYAYPEDGSYVMGAYTSEHNQSGGKYSTGILEGEAVILEYYEPVDVTGQGVINIETVAHVYRMGVAAASDPCEVDVACSPESDDWQDQIRGVVRILVSTSGGNGWCSGSLVNNTNLDCKPYVLLAYHCGLPGDGPNFSNFTFYFNYQKSGCGSGGASFSQNITGCTKQADSGDGGGNNGSDFLLLELNSAVPFAYTPYWNGWDATGTTSGSGVCIHHPAGDVKKISTYTTSTISATWGGPSGTHWRVRWAATTNGHGVTEGGSSGSPLFNSDGRIIGQLTGGGSYCTATTAWDYYGKMSYNWDSNPAAGDDLKLWLDPVGGGSTTTFDGTYYWCVNAVDEQEEFESNVSVYPNPTEGNVTVQFENPVQNGWIEVVNAMGQIIDSHQLGMGIRTYNLALKNYAEGLYYVNITDSEHSVTKKLTVVH